MGERPELRHQYDADLELLDEIILNAADHLRVKPECDAQPLCIGANNLEALRGLAHTDEGVTYRLVMVAVHEMSALRERVHHLEVGLAELADSGSVERAIREILRETD